MRERKPVIYKIKYLALFFGRDIQIIQRHRYTEDFSLFCIDFVNRFMSGYEEFWGEKEYPFSR